jgi:hypothetical protein
MLFSGIVTTSAEQMNAEAVIVLWNDVSDIALGIMLPLLLFVE